MYKENEAFVKAIDELIAEYENDLLAAMIVHLYNIRMWKTVEV